MKKFVQIVLATILISTAFFAGSARTASAKESKVLEFGTMTGVPRPYTGGTNAIRGVSGGGVPWVVYSAEGELTASGKLKVTVRGLVIDPNDAVAISRGSAGTNPSPTFKAIVSCLSKDMAGNPTTVNVSTDAFSATTGLASAGGGNADIEAMVSLPMPCIAPIIFVTSGSGSWFAATGF